MEMHANIEGPNMEEGPNMQMNPDKGEQREDDQEWTVFILCQVFYRWFSQEYSKTV